MIKKITGYWWLPNNPNKKCYGILKIFYSKRSTLEAKGIFTKKDDWSMFINPEFILGESNRGEKITLFNCSEYRCSPGDSFFHINTVFYCGPTPLGDYSVLGKDSSCSINS